MKKIATSISVFAMLFMGVTALKAQTWKKAYTFPSIPLGQINYVKDATAKGNFYFAFTENSDGTALLVKSTNGGKTFSYTIIDNSDSVTITNAPVGLNNTTYLAPAKNGIYKATSTVSIFSPVYYSKNINVQTIAAADESTVIAIAEPQTNVFKILRSTNGGTSWTVTNAPSNFHLNKIAIASSKTIFAFSNGKKALLRSTDGGATWTSLNELPAPGTTINISLQFIDATTGYATVQDYTSGKTTILKTTNAGTSWRTVYTAPSAVASLNMKTQTQGTLYYTAGEFMGMDSSGALGSSGKMADSVFLYMFAQGNLFNFAIGTDNNNEYYIYTTGIPAGMNDEPLAEKVDINIYPNPAAGNVLYYTCNVKNALTTQIIIADVSGKTVLQQNIKLNPGLNKNQLQIDELPKGIYLFTIKNAGFSQTSKFIKQ